MSPAETGGPAFPFLHVNQTIVHQASFHGDYKIAPGVAEQHGGMTLLDYFAAEALKSPTINAPGSRWSHEERAAWAYEQSVAMLAERQRRLSNKT